MTYKGHVENGVVVFDEPVTLANGTPVSVEVSPANEIATVDSRARFEHYRDVIGVLKNLPEDWSENHDKYLEEDYRR